MNINELRKNIEHQTRNGRTTVYLPISTIKELDPGFESSNEYEYVDVNNIEKLLSQYERNHFKESLKVDVEQPNKKQSETIVEYIEHRISENER